MNTFLTFDRVLAAVAIVLGVAGIWRAEYLFGELNKRASEMTDRLLGQVITIAASYSAFTRALQAVELSPMELPKDGAFALLTAFHLQKTRDADKLTTEELEQLRKIMRKQIDNEARGQAEMLIKSGLATMKPGVRFAPKQG